MLKFILMSMGLILVSSNWLVSIIFCFLMSVGWILLTQNYNLGLINLICVDQLSFMLVMLTFWLTALMYLCSYYIILSGSSYFMFGVLCMFMMMFLLLTFVTSDFFVFYVAFEATLIPIFLLVMGWGYQPERVTAAYYLLFYTLGASLPLLLALLKIYEFYGSLVYGVMVYSVYVYLFSGGLFWMMILAFLVKLPVYFFHLWLPKAHVEAPVAGSMILAGLLLKLGGYGLYRVGKFMYLHLQFYSGVLLCIGLMGGVVSSFVCLRQSDAKSLVAYSSVAHMALVLIGLTINSVVSMAGAIIIMVAHGLCSSGLFSLVGLMYNRLSSRSMLLMRGSLTMGPILALWWFLFSIANMAAPPTPNLMGEICLFISVLGWWEMGLGFLGAMSFLGAAYSLYLYSSIQHGSSVLNTSNFCEGDCCEFFSLFFHFLPLILLILYVSCLL